MGVPKFYRWISERYPCLSEIVKENQIPKFDNLYLDMNGIIHLCSHPNDDDPHFRISEEEIYRDIFHYVEVLFQIIQPTKVFYIAVDGVAPRAKMNQQRGRRFRSAREAKENERKAQDRGEVLPTEARFDSNCITPGTEFMTKLDAQLQYFISSKVTSDKLWQNCSVIYSGHKTPGEGEHKIMEYIRYARSQPNYDPHTRHCLYGLDADLIVLGLTSHEPYFSLLREEVRFGGKKGNKNKRMSSPEETTFHLLHLSLMREYIEYEFFELHYTLPFPFNLEAIIDDWVLMGFLVGNDFIPHLPGLHINKDALPLLYKMYKQVLPSLDGYLNEQGYLNLTRLEKLMTKLSEFDVETFHELNDNFKYLAGKRVPGSGELEGANERANQPETFEYGYLEEDVGEGKDEPLTIKEMQATFARLDLSHHIEDFKEEKEEEEEGSIALEDDDDELFKEEFRQHKRDYYMTKMLYEEVTSEVLHDQAMSYVRGLQWILHYYYNGICSWSWFYPHHYAPYISDVRDFARVDLSFEKGTPFLPFEQLLGVLPPLSTQLLPNAYQELMFSDNSPLKEFYPDEFKTDLNGKQQDWEAVVLIPFINEKILLETMKPCNEKLQPKEKERNTHGPMFIYKYTTENLGEFKAPDYFPPIGVNRAKVEHVWREDWDLTPLKIIKGILPGIKEDVYFSDFPTLKHLLHKFRKEAASVRVFQQESRGESFILEVCPKMVTLPDLLKNVLGKVVFVNWPRHVIEAKVVSICSEKSQFYLREDGYPPSHENLDEKQVKFWETQKDDLMTKYFKRWGVDVGEIKFIIYTKQMSGRMYVADQDGRLTLEKTWSEFEQPYPLQLVIPDIALFDSGFKQYETVQEYFTLGSKVFMLGHPNYGCMGEVIESYSQHKGRIGVSMIIPVEPNLQTISQQWQLTNWGRYATAYECSTHLSISAHLFARLTGSVFMAKALELNPFMDRETATNKFNIGLNLKNNNRSEEVVGFTRRCQVTNQWLYSDKCINCLIEYQSKFPEIFEFLNRNPSRNDIFQDEVFPTTYNERVPELMKWLKEAPFTFAERQKWGTLYLDDDIITEITKEVEHTASQRAKLVKLQVKPQALFKPNPIQGSTPPDPQITFELFDRVVNVREGFSVPLGAIGTVIGIQNESGANQKVGLKAQKESEKLLIVLFDQPFTGGLTLGGSASTNRCYRLTWAAMINISHGKRMKNQPAHSFTYRVSKHKVEKTLDNGSKVKVPGSDYEAAQSLFPLMDSALEERFPPGHKETTPSVKSGIPKTATVPYTTPETYKSSGDGEQKKEHVLQPPNPNQLPKPSQFTGQPRESQNSENTTFSTAKRYKSSPRSYHKNPVQMIKSESDVKVVIHGNFYEHWPSIRKKGLRRDHRHYIPCVSYVPPRLEGAASSRSYEIHIYLKVGKLLSDGMRLLRMQSGQVLCSTNINGFLPPEYFEKVVDTVSGLTIFPTQDDPKEKEKIFFSPAFFLRNSDRCHRDHLKRRGRGIHTSSDSSHTMQFCDEICTQMQNVSSSCIGKQPETQERKEVTIGELFKLASLDESTKSPPRFVPSDQSSHVYSVSQYDTPPSSYQAPSSLFNLMTPHISDFQPYAHLNSQTSNSQPYLHYISHDHAHLNSPRNQMHTFYPTHYTHSNPQHNSFQFDLGTHFSSSNNNSNSSNNDRPQFTSFDENTKSRFVPTQVTRKQTPRKLYLEGQPHQSHTPQKSVLKPPPPEPDDRSRESIRCDSGETSKASKPKRKQRNRLAANLGLVEPVRHNIG